MAEASTTARTDTRQVRVWDLPTRIFHWMLVALMVMAWASFEFSEALNDPTLKLHRYTGYTIIILVIWRLIWGVIGSPSARFKTFVKGPRDVLQYTMDLIRGRDRRYLGHNPLGSYGVLALLGLVGLQGVLGLMAEEHNGVTWGPLSHLTSMNEEITELHEELFYAGILAVVVIHVVANLYHGFFKREPLIVAMFTGRKPGHETDYSDAESKVYDSPLRTALLAAAVLAVSAVIFAGGITFLGGRLFY